MAQKLSLALIIQAVDKVTRPVKGMVSAVHGLGDDASAALDRTSDRAARLSAKINAITTPVRKVGRAINRLSDSSGLTRLGKSLGGVAGGFQRVGQASLPLLVGAGGIGYAFKQMFINPATQFENFMTQLKVLEGGMGPAKQSMAWIEEFAAQTPYEMDQVVESFVKLRGYGLDPTNGLLRTLGDTAAGMGKDVMQAVEAVADALNGENERLKEFGIKGRVVKNKMVYEYSHMGEQVQVAVNKNDRAAIEKTLGQIFNSKFGGSMDELSKNWTGIMSNLMDLWTMFTRSVMSSGAFDWLKSKLQGLLDKVNALRESGEFDKIATDIGSKLVGALEKLWSMGQKVYDVLGFDGILITIAAVIAGPLLAAIGSLTVAVVTLGTAIGLTPVGWILGALAALAAGAYMLYKHWDTIAGWFRDLWTGIAAAFEHGLLDGVAHILDVFNPLPILAGTINSLLSWLFGINFGPVAGNWFSSLLAGVRSGLSSLQQWIDTAFVSMGQWILAHNPFTALAGAVSDMVAWFSSTDLFSAGADLLSKFVDGFLSVLVNFNPLSLLLTAVNDMINGLLGIDLFSVGKEWFGKLTAGIGESLSGLVDWIPSAVDSMSNFLPDIFPDDSGSAPEKSSAAQASPALPSKPAQAEVKGKVVVEFKGAPPGMRVAGIKSDTPGVDIDVDAGYALQTP